MKDEYEEEERSEKRENVKVVLWEWAKIFLVVFNTIAGLASIIGFAASLFSDEKKGSIIYLSLGILFFAMMLAVIILIRSNKNDKMREVSKYARGFHEVLHLIRDSFEDLQEVEAMESYNTPAAFRKYMTEKVMVIMDVIAKNISDATGHKVRSCVKMFDFIRNGEVDKNKIKLITLARSGRTSVNNMINEHYNPISLSENSDFSFIFDIKEGYDEERVHFFFQDDLIRYAKKNTYNNSNPKWKKRYKTTIVMPIRYLIIPENDDEAENNEPHYDLIGFLCVDSKKKKLFSIEKRGFILEYLKGISDILYVYLDECILYHEYLKEGNRK